MRWEFVASNGDTLDCSFDVTVNFDPGTTEFADPTAASRSVEIEDNAESVGMQLYPNPATETFSVIVQGIESEGQLYIYDMTGSLVYKQDVNRQTTMITIDADAHLNNAGVYVVTLNTGTRLLTERVVINK